MNFRLTIIDDFLKSLLSLKDKIAHLSETNYQLGLSHLKNGNIKEALARFKIIIFFWPKHHKANYQYAYCLTLENKIENARIILTKLTAEYPDYLEASGLLNAIKENTIDKIKEEYKATLLEK
jgi:TolA-binding protein